ncbi:MAG: imidazole glycerol phosphate synthase subunit HisF [Thermoguttaceae bacterium]
MDYCKIIPCLDTKNGRLVKGVNFVNLKELGDPAESAAAYCEAGADELVFLDITATLEERKTLIEAVKRTVARINIPLTVGGGISSMDNIAEMFDIGVTKVSMNSAAVRDPELVKKAAEKYGSDRITVAIDTRKSETLPSGFEVVVSGGTKGTGLDAVAWAKEVSKLGAGAILPTSMDTDGKQTGYDIPMTRAIADAVTLPIIASGGAGTLEHLFEVIDQGHAKHVLVASIAHFGTFTIRQMREFLASKGVKVSDK